ncbi:hypothetical protein PTKIN_Ptkin11bG0052100 [Pterospermum kingtungense]
MEEKATTVSHDFAVNNGKESLVDTENNSPESQVQADDEAGALGSGEGSGSGATSKETVNEKKRGRGRPRKYESGFPNSSASLEALPSTIMASSSTKRARGRPKGTGRLQALASVGGYVDTAGGSFTPHVLSVHTGEDLVNKIGSFCARVSRSVCVLAASGAVSSVTLCKPDSSVGTLIYEGWFEILTLSGSSVVSGELGTRRKTGLLSVSLANSHGRVFGGSVAGPVIAAGPGPIQLIVASFKQNIGCEIRRKYSAGTSTPANIFASSEMVNVPIQETGMDDNYDNCTPTPATVTVRADCMKSDNNIAENHNFNSTSAESLHPNNSQKADTVKADNVIIGNHKLTSPETCVGPNNLKTMSISQLISDDNSIH